MKKIYYKLLLLMLVAAIAGPFVLRDRDGRPLMSIRDLRMPEIDLPDTNALKDAMHAATDSVASATDEVRENSVTKTSTRIYRWQDEEGGWHFSNSAPGERGVTEIAVDTSVNVMHMESAVPARDPAADATSIDAGAGSIATPISSLLPLTQGADMMRDARRVSAQLKARHDSQVKAMGD